MTKAEINQLLEQGIFPGKATQRQLVETHISWVILTDDFAFKIKKPLKLHFLDFSTLEVRKASCETEYKLNSRLAADMYLGVLPVRREEGKWQIGEGPGEIEGYALWMKKLDPNRQMHLLLQQNNVTKSDMRQLAKQVAAFHQQADVIRHDLDLEALKAEFNDLSSVSDFVDKKLGQAFVGIIDDSVKKSSDFLDAHEQLLQARQIAGFTRDVHGDLHAGNIFLLDTPVIFDCIEFNDAFRQIDLLNEIAFFCMDLEAHGKQELSRCFLEKYLEEMEQMEGLFHESLFTYYKAYRANVRAKVKALAAMQEIGSRQDVLLEEVKGYLSLLKEYVDSLSA